MELPATCVAAEGDKIQPVEGTSLAPGIWCDRPTHETAIFAERYEMTISLLVFEDAGVLPDGWEDEGVEDALHRFERDARG
jgi:hypothetical protein